MNRNHLRAAALIPLALLLTHCDRVQSLFKKKPPQPTPYDFSIVIEMTPEAAARVQHEDADILVRTYFYGVAKPEYRAKADEINRLRLGYKEAVYDTEARRLRVSASEIDPKDLPLTVDGKANVFLTVAALLTKDYDRRKGEMPPEHMIQCDGYTGPIELAQARPPVVHCDIWRP